MRPWIRRLQKTILLKKKGPTGACGHCRAEVKANLKAKLLNKLKNFIKKQLKSQPILKTQNKIELFSTSSKKVSYFINTVFLIILVLFINTAFYTRGNQIRLGHLFLILFWAKIINIILGMARQY